MVFGLKVCVVSDAVANVGIGSGHYNKKMSKHRALPVVACGMHCMQMLCFGTRQNNHDATVPDKRYYGR